MIAAALLACAANVSPVTLEAVMRVESGGNPLTLNVNRLAGPQPHPSSAAEAAQVARGYIARGFSVDIGVMQVNSRNLAALGYTIEQVLDPCTSIAAGGKILTADYAEAVQRLGVGQPALKAALSAYNTGTFWRGFANGYVARYYGHGGVPALVGGVAAIAKGGAPPRQAPPPNPYTADTAVYVREAVNVRVE